MKYDIQKITINDYQETIVLGAANGDPCDIPATVALYVEQVKDELALRFPGASVDYQWGGNGRLKIEIEGEYALDDHYEIVSRVQTTLEDVYERGDFWVPLD